jgi:hypothetical protein
VDLTQQFASVGSLEKYNGNASKLITIGKNRNQYKMVFKDFSVFGLNFSEVDEFVEGRSTSKAVHFLTFTVNMANPMFTVDATYEVKSKTDVVPLVSSAYTVTDFKFNVSLEINTRWKVVSCKNVNLFPAAFVSHSDCKNEDPEICSTIDKILSDDVFIHAIQPLEFAIKKCFENVTISF